MSDFSRLLSGFSRSFGCTYTGVFLPLIPPRFTFLVGGWSSSMALLLLGRLPPPLPPAIAGSFSLSLPSPLPAVLQFLCTVRCFCFGVVSTCQRDLLLLGFLLFIRLGTWVLRCPSSPLSLGDSTFFMGFTSSSFTASAFHFFSPWIYFLRASVVMPCDFLSAFSFSFGLHPDVSAFAFPGSCLFRSSAIIFLSVCVCVLGRLAWLFHALRLLSLVYLPLSFLLFRHFLSFFRRSSDSAESPLHSATGSSFGPSQLLFSLTSIISSEHLWSRERQ